MNYSNHRLTFDIHDILSNTVVKVKRGDNTHRLCISLTENGKVYQIADSCTAVFKGKKPDGFSLYNDCTIEDNCIYYVMGNNTTSALGVVSSEVSLISEKREVITSPTFSILVEDTTIHDDDVFDSSDEVTALVELVAETTALKKEVEEVLDRVVIDDALNSESNHPVSNAAITKEFDNVYGEFDGIDNALDRSMEILGELLPPTPITFAVGGNEYQALSGMTWLEWVNSEYNIHGFRCDGADSYVHPDAGATHLAVRLNDYVLVVGSDKIISDISYRLDYIGQ